MNTQRYALATVLLTLAWPLVLLSQGVGIETTTPDSTFSVSNKIEVGGSQGDLLFTDDMGSITFPTTSLPNAPMIQMFSGGLNNADRMVISHSSAYQNWGLLYKDVGDQFHFGIAGASSNIKMGLADGHMSVGETPLNSQSTFIAASTNDATTGHFINTYTAGTNVNSVYSSISGGGSGNRRAGLFEALQGTGRTFGMYATSALADTNVAVYGSIGLLDLLPGDINRAGWFEDGDVVIDDRMLIGSNSLGDAPDSSALLELNSTTRGLLFPRMTGLQRLDIVNPAEGLVVYDSDAKDLYLHDGSTWGSVGSGGGGGGLWLQNGSPVGPYVGSGNSVGIGDVPKFFRRAYIATTAGLPFGLEIDNEYSGGLGKYGLYVEASSAGTNTRYGVYSKSWASLDDDPAYGVYAEANQATTAADVYGIYAKAAGTGSGARWAGYFEGDAKITENIHVDGDLIKIQPKGWLAGSRLMLTDDDGTATIDLHGNQNPGEGAEIWMRDDAGNLTLELDSDNGVGGSYFRLMNDAGATRIRMDSKENSTEGPEFIMYNSSTVKSVEIDGDVGGNGSGGIDVYDEDGTLTYSLRAAEAAGQGSSLKMHDATGDLKIELDADFNGDGRIITDELEIKGGSDLAEYFDVSENSSTVVPGSVVVVDPAGTCQVKLSTQAYDKKVIGIVSGANGVKPGMLMGQEGSIAFGDVPVAIVGRVYVRVDLSEGTIMPGDFLTTSDRPGLAMRVNDWERARGSILGKALTAPDDEGFVLILVQLQ